MIFLIIQMRIPATQRPSTTGMTSSPTAMVSPLCCVSIQALPRSIGILRAEPLLQHGSDLPLFIQRQRNGRSAVAFERSSARLLG